LRAVLRPELLRAVFLRAELFRAVLRPVLLRPDDFFRLLFLFAAMLCPHFEVFSLAVPRWIGEYSHSQLIFLH